MTETPPSLAMIGFGEAAKAFARGFGSDLASRTRAYDRRTERETARDGKLADYAEASVKGCESLGEALDGAAIVLCLVPPDQTRNAARAAADALALAPDALYCDMTSVSPDTTREAAALIERAGGRYVDVGVMSPVGKFLNKVAMKGSGPHAAAAREALAAYGFELEVVEGDVGQASAIKMVRSVIVKGLEALTTEWLLAAEAVGVTDDVVVSLKGKWPGIDWAEKGDYNLGRMMLHGKRRAAEMDEAVRTLEALGVSARMSAATRDWHRSVGEMALPAPEGLREKLRLVRAGGVPTA